MIAYIVSSFEYNNTGAGGHYYTAVSIFTEMVKHQSACLIVLGDLKPRAIDFSTQGTIFIKVSRWLKPNDFNCFYQAIKNNISVLHAFDSYSFLFARTAGLLLNIRVLSTKCGGPPPKLGYYPRICPDIVFSPEDDVFYKKRALFFHMPPPMLWPNRVTNFTLQQHGNGLLDLPGLQNQESIKILRIARICSTYEKSILQTVELSRELKKRGLQVVLYIVGYIEDVTVFEKIQRSLSNSDYLLTDDRYTQNASRHLQQVDIVVASGRGVMEACYSGKIICCSVKDSHLPFLLDADNFDHFFHYNFSSRAGKPNIDHLTNIIRIITLVNSQARILAYRNDMESIRSTYFDISTIIPKYIQLYKEDRVRNKSFINLIDLSIHLLLSIAKLLVRKIQKQQRTPRTIGIVH